MTLRSIWSGTIPCGLVSVPVRTYSVTESKELRLHFLHKDDLHEETKKGRKRRQAVRKAS